MPWMTTSKRRWVLFPWTGFDFVEKQRKQRAVIVLSLAAVFVLLCPVFAAAQSEVWSPLEERLVQDGFDRAYVEKVFGNDALEFSPEIMARKMNSLLNIKLSNRKPGPRAEPEVMDRYLNPILIAGAYAFYKDKQTDFDAIEAKYGVPGEVLTALLLVETKLGTQVGSHKAVHILASMALAEDFELIRSHIERTDLSPEMQSWLMKRTVQKANWGYTELKSLLTYTRRNGSDPLEIPSSMYGAIGSCQFIPSSALHYGVDGSGDGKVDLFEMTDALHSMANFVKRHGWKPGLDHEAQLKVIYRYNHSESYAMTILAVADKIRKTKEFFGD